MDINIFLGEVKENFLEMLVLKNDYPKYNLNCLDTIDNYF